VNYLLDTNVISELRRPAIANSKVLAWASATPVSALFLSAITMLEIELGTVLIERKDGERGRELRRWINEQIMPHFDRRILPVDTVVAVRCARLHADGRKPERDALIAATALVHSMTVVTRNVSDFAPCGVAVFNPWD
jgi:toxin FitB